MDEFGMTPFQGRGMGKEEAAVCQSKFVFEFPGGQTAASSFPL